MFSMLDRWWRRRQSKRALKKSPIPGLKRLGSEYGGKTIPLERFNADSVCYSVGVGEDLSFDRAWLDQTHGKIFAFDPTPRAVEYVRSNAADWKNFTFQPVALWTEDASLTFHPPTDPAHVSHSLVPQAYAPEAPVPTRELEVPCKRLDTLMRQYGHSKIDLLKMDIEGAEYAVLDQARSLGIRPGVLCIEFHPDPQQSEYRLLDAKTLRAFANLRAQGYQLADAEGWNFTFVRG